MRRSPAERRERLFAAIEIPALGIWLGALVGFAFIFAPLSFRLVAPLSIGRFAVLIAQNVATLTVWGYVLGAIAILAAAARAIGAADRAPDFVRIALIAAALGLATYEQRAIVPSMTAATETRSVEYLALHRRSTAIYGVVVVLVFGALVMAAHRRER